MMFAQVLGTECKKLRRSKVTWGSLIALSLGPLGIALFMWILREPDRAAKLGLLGAKANLSGMAATWPSFLSMLTLIVGIGGMLILSFIVAYVFGREYSEGTAKNMLALPVGRPWFVLAKLAVTAIWWFLLVAAVVAEALLIGTMLRLPGFSSGLLIRSIRNAMASAALAYLLVPIVAWISALGRGYMPPLAFTMTMMALGNIFSKTGWAPWFPWSIIPLLIGMVGQPVEALPPGSYVVAALTFVSGIAATLAQVLYADNTQ